LVDPLLMNAFNNVNLAGAVILTSTDYATELGIPKSQWVYPLGGAGTRDSDKCMHVHQPEADIANSCSLGAPELLLKSLHYEISGRGSGSLRTDERSDWPL
jgi:hypothetical protein